MFPYTLKCFECSIYADNCKLDIKFDTNINNILFKNIINIEKSLKSKISYIISKKYGVYTDIEDITNNNEKDYLCRLNYKGSNHRNNTLVSIKNEINKKKKEPDVSHYLNNHNHLPCWN
ncbi:Abi family protein [[Clostridium] innocuum]|uniref:Abi family protein n=1 Tax=Clostridium innocuum TaxID=1522 RepID=UPI003A4E5223